MNNFDYKNMTPFKWFVLENFPFIENDFDAINNYHLFSKVVEYLNKTIDNMNLTGEQMENVTNAMTELQNYVNNYFDTLDVQDEINNKLDEMAQDGTLSSIIDLQYIIYNKNIELLGNFYKKLCSHQNITINCQGDSLTYGQDTSSSSVRPGEGTTDSGNANTHTRANTTYPEQLQILFNNTFDDFVVTVNNLGHSGDTAQTSYENWTINRNADLAIIMLGTNDSRVTSWVDSSYYNHIDLYVEYISKIITRYLNWNTGIILLTPPAYNYSSNNFKNGNTTTQIYRNILKMIGKKYNIPVVNTDDLITTNFDSSFYSDQTHFNEKGYVNFANKLFSIFCGTGIINDNFNISNFQTFNASVNYPLLVNNYSSFSRTSLPNTQTSNGNIIGINQLGKIIYGFNVEYDNALIIPILGNTNCNPKIYVDNNNLQQNATLRNSNYGVNYNSLIENIDFDTARHSIEFKKCLINAIANNYYLLIPSKRFAYVNY